MNIYVVRHGQTDWNKNHFLQGVTDVELNSTGIEQAHEVKEKLKNINFNLIYTSPLKRTLSTASIVNAYHNVEIISTPDLLERSFGDLEGLHGSKVNMPPYWDLNLNLSNSNVESIKSFLNRIKVFLDALTTNPSLKNKDILLVTHNGVHIGINYYFNGLPQNKTLLDLGLNNCEYSLYHVDS